MKKELKKRNFYTELSYALGLVILAFSCAMITKASFGVSMVVAPAYILHLKISDFLPFFSFGLAAYTFQALLLILTVIILRRAKLSYLFSFVTAVIYGFLLDGFVALLSFVTVETLVLRIVFFAVGAIICPLGVALLFHTYIPAEAYEVFVMEISAKLGMSLHKFKTIYDCASCVLSVIMSFCFFGWLSFNGIGWGTVICALINGPLIGLYTKLLNKKFRFEDGLPLRRFF